MQLMTQAEFARHRRVSKPAVSNWKKAGLLVLQEDEQGRIKVNVQRTEARLNAKIDPMRGRPPVAAAADPLPALPLEPAPGQPATGLSPSDISLATERVEELRERRIGSALKNAQMAGDLVPLTEAERRVSEVGRAARERVHAWLRSVAERFAAERDVRAIMAIAEEGIDTVFAELADTAGKGAFAGGEDDELTADEVAELEAAAEQT